MNGSKNELSVLFNGIASDMFTRYFSFVLDIEIFEKKRDWHNKFGKKKLEDYDLDDDENLYDEKPLLWAMIWKEKHWIGHYVSYSYSGQKYFEHMAHG